MKRKAATSVPVGALGFQTGKWRNPMATEFPPNPNPRGRKDMGDYTNMRWGIPIGIGAVALIAAMVIFSAAAPGPHADRQQQPALSRDNAGS